MTRGPCCSSTHDEVERPIQASADSYAANGVVYRKALPADDGELRAILRSECMDSWVKLSLEREPSFFAAEGVVGESAAVIASEARPPHSTVGMYTCAFLPVHVNGCPEYVGYLGGLRVKEAYRHKIRIVKGGFSSIRHVVGNRGTVPFWFTSVADDNSPACRLLEAGLKGMPIYRFVGNVATFAFSITQGKRHGLLQQAKRQDVPALVEFYNRQSAAYQFSPVMTEEWLLSLSGRYGLRVEDFWLLKDGGNVRGALAIWDQRTYKQVTIRGYRRPLDRLRVPFNWWARLSHRAPLPATGQRLEQVSLAFVAFDGRARSMAVRSLREALTHVGEKAATVGICGLSPLNALYPSLKKELRSHIFLTRIETVAWPSDPEPALDARPPQPEIATL